MAKLSAHGKELLRIEKEVEETNPESSTSWNRRTRAYMADGKVLEKFDVRFKPTTYSKGELYSYGWKLKAKKKADVSMADYLAMVQRIAGKANESGWTIVSGGPAPVIIDQKRIIRAIESGEHIGFCKACGHSAHGVEPDARNYTCESCGMSEVYGAEEMLIAG